MIWRSKKQNVVVKSSAKAKYCAMADTMCEIIWLKSLLKELRVEIQGPFVTISTIRLQHTLLVI